MRMQIGMTDKNIANPQPSRVTWSPHKRLLICSPDRDDFTDSYMQHAELIGIFEYKNFEGTRLAYSAWHHVYTFGSNFYDADLAYNQLFNCNFYNCDFRHADFCDSFVERTTFYNCNLDKTLLQGATFLNCVFVNCNIDLAYMNDTLFIRCKLDCSPLPFEGYETIQTEVVNILAVVPVPQRDPKPATQWQTIEEAIEMDFHSGTVYATDGCIVEPDGYCPHGCPSVLLQAGLI